MSLALGGAHLALGGPHPALGGPHPALGDHIGIESLKWQGRRSPRHEREGGVRCTDMHYELVRVCAIDSEREGEDILLIKDGVPDHNLWHFTHSEAR